MVNHLLYQQNQGFKLDDKAFALVDFKGKFCLLVYSEASLVSFRGHFYKKLKLMISQKVPKVCAWSFLNPKKKILRPKFMLSLPLNCPCH